MYVHGIQHPPERHLTSHIHCQSSQNSQEMETIYMPLNWWIVKTWHTRKFNSARKKHEIMKLTGKWVELEHTIMNEVIMRQMLQSLSYLWILDVLFLHGFWFYFIFTWTQVFMLTRQTLNWLSHLPSLQAWSMELNWLCSTPTSGAQKLWEFRWSTWTLFTLISSLATSREKRTPTLRESLPIKNMKIWFTDLIWC